MPGCKRLPTIPILTLACLLGWASLGHAEQRYIADTIVVSLREGPGSQFKVIKPLKTGQSFEVLENRNDYLRVRTPEGDEGWIKDQFTDTKPPNAFLANDLNEQITTLTAQNERLTAQLAGKGLVPHSEVATPALPEESIDIKKVRSDLAELTTRYAQLEADAKDILPITKERERLQKELSAMQESLAALRAENASLAYGRKIYWFLAGGGVFLLGWIIGRLSFRRPRHSLTL